MSSVYPRHAQDVEVPWMRESIRRLVDRGATVRVLAPSWKGLASHEIDGVRIHRFRYAPAAFEILTHDEGAPSKLASRPWMQLLAIPYMIVGALLCFWLCLRKRPDVIHAHWPFPHGLMAIPTQKLLGIPLVLNFHGAELLLIRKHAWVAHVLRFVIRNANAVLANSSFTAAKIKALHPCSVTLSPYGTTLASNPYGTTLASSPYGTTPFGHSEIAYVPKSTFVVLFVGRHIERKGLRYLIDAATELDPQKFQIRIVGHGDLTDSLQTYAREKAPLQVVFTGKLTKEQLEHEYRSASCFVLPAIVDSKGDTEGLGVVLIEAAELGLPLVASDVGGIPDVVENGVSGLLVPEKNSKALAQAFQKLATDPTFAQSLVQGAIQKIDQQFTWTGIVARQLELYEGLRSRRS